MHQADIVVKGQVDVLGRELLRGQHTVAVESPVFIGPLPVEALGRGAKVDAQHAVNGTQDLGLLRAGCLQATCRYRRAY